MRRGSIITLIVLTSVLFCFTAEAREPEKSNVRPKIYDRPVDAAELGLLRGERPMTAAAVDTYDIVYYDFETMDWQGWTRKDLTAWPDTFWHVDDFDGLGGGDYGLLFPIEGTKSMWCGARQDWSNYMCNWNNAPGYGNAWDQKLVTEPIYFTGVLRLSYHGVFDSEPNYDSTTVEYATGEDEWEYVASYDGVKDVIASHEIYCGLAKTKLRFHFTSDGAWSDQDGLWNTDGAAIVDSITIWDDSGSIDYEDFESAEVGDRNVGIWHVQSEPGFGTYSGLWANLLDHDPCGENISTQIIFFAGSTDPTPSWDPQEYATPFCKGAGGVEAPCQQEAVWSPIIDMRKYTTGRNEIQDADIPPAKLPDLGGAYLSYTLYENLPLVNLVFYTWEIRPIINNCPQSWFHRDFVWYGYSEEYVRKRHWIDDQIADSIQVAFKVTDMCDLWFQVYGNCEEHTSGPYFDNVLIQRYDKSGPQWSYRRLDLFQDNFPMEEDIESFVRADCANDLMPCDNPTIRPGDSIVVQCTSPLGGGIAEDAFGPRIYMHVKCTYIGDDGLKPDLAGPSLEGTYGSYLSDNGIWTIIQGDTAKTASGHNVPDRYVFDLNDSLFTRGYMIEYYFKAYDVAGLNTTCPENAETVAGYPYYNGSYLFEFTCLPTLNSANLYVDDYDGRGTWEGLVQVYLERTFCDVGLGTQPPDRYDVNDPTSLVSNSLAGRAKLSHMLGSYLGVIWDSGYLMDATLGDGTCTIEKSDDVQMLIDWMDQIDEDNAGVLIMGDNIAYDLDNRLLPNNEEFMTGWCGVTLENYDYNYLTGGINGGGVINPEITGLGVFSGVDFCLFGGCPTINRFDVIEKADSAVYVLQYPDYDSQSWYAGIGNARVNSMGHWVHTLWFGFSFMYIRDCGQYETLARNEILYNALRNWMQTIDGNPDITGDEVPAVTALAQNYPNPFNPVTTICFDLASRGHVRLRIYNVAGQLVRVLSDEVKKPGRYNLTWDGTNDAGSQVASGVYFYRMETGDYERSRKMVLLR